MWLIEVLGRLPGITDYVSGLLERKGIGAYRVEREIQWRCRRRRRKEEEKKDGREGRRRARRDKREFHLENL